MAKGQQISVVVDIMKPFGYYTLAKDIGEAPGKRKVSIVISPSVEACSKITASECASGNETRTVNGYVLQTHNAVLVFDDGIASNLEGVAKEVLFLLANFGA